MRGFGRCSSTSLHKHESHSEVQAKAIAGAEGPQEHQPQIDMTEALKMKVEDERQLRCDRCAVETNIEKIPTAFSDPPSTHCTIKETTESPKIWQLASILTKVTTVALLIQ